MKHYTEKYNDRLRRMQKNNSAEYDKVIIALAACDNIVLTSSNRLSTKTTADTKILDELIPTATTKFDVNDTDTDTDTNIESTSIEDVVTVPEDIADETVTEITTEVVDIVESDIQSETPANSNTESLTKPEIYQVTGILNRAIKIMEVTNSIGSSEFYKKFIEDINELNIATKDGVRISPLKLMRVGLDNVNFIGLTRNWISIPGPGLGKRAKRNIEKTIDK